MFIINSSKTTGYVSTDIMDVGPFLPKDTFDCGQCFRWIEQDDGSFTGVVDGRVLNVSQFFSKVENGAECTEETNSLNSVNSPNASTSGDVVLSAEKSSAGKQINCLRVLGATPEFCEDFLLDYLDLNTDYDRICRKLAKKDAHMKAAINYSEGIRILRQPLVETIFSFIISANNNVPRIMGIIDRLCKQFGEKCEAYDEPQDQLRGEYYSFPTIEQLCQASVDDIKALGAGYRAPYIVETAHALYDLAQAEGGMDKYYERLCGLSLEEARAEILKLQGVGPKVADCILLFSGINTAAFPTDVWVKRIMELLYGNLDGAKDNGKNGKSLKQIMTFAEKYFGELAGYAQQYLFNYARKNKLGV